MYKIRVPSSYSYTYEAVTKASTLHFPEDLFFLIKLVQIGGSFHREPSPPHSTASEVSRSTNGYQEGECRSSGAVVVRLFTILGLADVEGSVARPAASDQLLSPVFK